MDRDAQRPLRTGPSSVSDPRYVALKHGLEQLTSDQLQQILDYRKEMVYDMYNYDEDTGRY